MFSNIASKIKTLAKVLCWVGIGLSVIMGLITMASGSGGGAVAGLLIIVFGSLGAWISSFFVYGFGQLIENTEQTDYKQENVE